MKNSNSVSRRDQTLILAIVSVSLVLTAVPYMLHAQDKGGDLDVGTSISEPSAAVENPDLIPLRVISPVDLEQAIEDIQSKFQAQALEIDESVRNIHNNQNKARVAAAVLATNSDLLGVLGPAVNRIANEYQESIAATIKIEERIQNRSWLSSFFFGGDDDAVADLEQYLMLQQKHTEELGRLIDVWGGNWTVKTILQEQITIMEQEQTRLQKVASEESVSKGLFNYILFWRN